MSTVMLDLTYNYFQMSDQGHMYIKNNGMVVHMVVHKLDLGKDDRHVV